MIFTPKNFHLQWHITERCNWRCKHCYQESYETPEMNQEQLFGVLDQYLKLIKKWKLEKEKVSISITGGEPLISSHFFPLLERMHKFGNFFSYSILSNGSLLNPEIVKKIKNLGVSSYQVSLEGMEKNNDEVRGKGSFQKVIEAVKLLAGQKIHTSISVSLNRKNVGDIEEMADFFSSFSRSDASIIIRARRMVPIGNALEMKNLLQEPLELKEFYEKVEEINKKMIRNNANLKIVGGCENGIFNNLVSDYHLMSIEHCQVLDGRILVVMPNGDVYPCRRLPIKAGNILNGPLEKVYYSSFMEKFRDRNNDPEFCKKCQNRWNCLSGAPCVTYGYTGKIDIPDVQCWRAYNSLEEALGGKFS